MQTRLTLYPALVAAALSIAPRVGSTAPAAAPASDVDSGDGGPEITIDPVLRAEEGSGVLIEAEISDRDGVFEPKIFYRAMGETKYRAVEMVSAGGANRFRGEIPSIAVIGPLEYFIEAYDKQGNGPSRSASSTRPHQLFVEKHEAPKVPTARAPDIVHQLVERFPAGKSIPIEASFRGPSGVFNPVLFFRRVGSASFTPLTMAELPASAAGSVAAGEGVILGTAGTGRFVAEIPSAFTNGDVEYYLEAMDSQGNGPTQHGTRERPHVVRTFDQVVQKNEAPDPAVALVGCLEIPREGEKVDTKKLGACRAPFDGASPSTVAKFNLGELKLRYESFTDAVTAFDEVTKEAEKWPAAWFRLGQAAEGNMQWAKANDAYKHYLELAGKPPEAEALLKRLALVEFKVGLERNRAAEQAAREAQKNAERMKTEAERDAERKRLEEKRLAEEAERARQQQLAATEQKKKYLREALLSASGQFLYATFAREEYRHTPDDFLNSTHEYAGLVGLRGRFKIPAVPPLILGAGVTAMGIGKNGDPADFTPGASVSALIGLNVLALPAPSKDGFTLLSPFVAYEPRFFFLGKPQSIGSAPLTHTVLFGNHFEFGDFSIEASYGMGFLGNPLERRFELALGTRLGSSH